MKYLIIARWNEDLTWVEDVPEEWTPLVVYKDVCVPNEGRESSSYIYGLERLLDGLTATDTVAFMQGYPWHHCDHAVECLDGPMNGFTYLGDWIVECDKNGQPNHPDLDIGGAYDRWVGGDRPRSFQFVAGAQWVMPASHALKYDHQYYQDLFQWANEDEKAPWILERLFPYIFSSP